MSDIKELIKSKLRPIGDAIREKNGSTELIPLDDMPQAIRDIQGGGGGIVEVTELPSVGKANTVYKLIHKNVGTEVPTTGLIENVYLNTSLSIDEVNAILKTIEYIPATNEGEPDIYIVFQTLDSIVRIFDYNNGSYAIMVGMNVAYVSDESFVSAGATFVGWNPDLTNPCVVYQESTPTDDFVSQNDKLTELFSTTPFSGDSADYYIYEKGEPTQVPNIGWIENLYFNTKLSNEEVDAILSQLTYDTDGYAYVVGAYEKGSSYGDIIIVEANAFTQGQIPSGYIIGHMHDTTNMASTEFIYVSNQGLVDLALTIGINTKVGWNMETLNLNQEFIGEYGTENDKLINVISTTKYSGWVSLGGGATVKATPIAVPNTGYVERVYFNKSLTFDEVNAICTKANNLVANETLKVNCILNTKDNSKVLTVMKFTETDDSTFNVILYPDWLTVIWAEKDFTSSDGTMTFNKGWNIEQDYLEINAEVVAVSEDDIPTPCGTYNDQLTELFSINNVFKTEEVELNNEYDGSPLVLSNKYVKKIVVPNEGYVERVYFNTSLSVEEVKTILEKFHTYVDVDTLDNAMWLINIDDFNNSSVAPEKLYWIMPSRDTGDYAILNALAQVIFKSNSSKWAGGDFVGWNPEFIAAEKPYLEINSQVFPIVTENGKEIKIGGFNDKIVDLFSLTPFEETIYDSVEVDIKEMLEEKKLPLEIKVNVESQEPNLQEKEITENGEYVADEGYDGFSKVTVNVKSSGSSENTLKKLLDGRKEASYLFRSFSGESVDDLISYSDTENVTKMDYMFNSCSVLKTIPQLDTSKVTSMSNMFNSCSVLKTIPQLDTSKVTNMSKMFYNCWNLAEIPQLDTSKVTDMNSMFFCSSSGDGNKYLKTITLTDTSNVTHMNSMFDKCRALETISKLDMIKIKDAYYADFMFRECMSLTNLTLLNIKVNLQIGSGDGTGSFDWGHLLTLESLINTVKELINVGKARTLTMGSANLSKIASTYVKFTDSSVTSIPTNEKGDVVVCELTDEGAMLLSDYALLKNWTLA